MDRSALNVAATKPKGRPARMLAEMGIRIVPIEEDEGNVDRYVLSKRLAIERRTGSSFLAGIQDKTLFTSAITLREHFRLPVLIVEGEVDYEYSMFDPQAVRGALCSMMLLYGLNVLATPSVEETVALLAMMARQEQMGIREISLIPKRKAVDLADQQRRLVEMLPGCGMVMARELLQHFGSVRRILEATEHELRAVRGIGAKKARRMVKVLNAEYEAVDTERHLEDAVAAAPELVFDRPVVLLARQHYVFSDAERRHFVDLVFVAQDGDELILVELKRGKLAPEHARQLRQYMDQAPRSSLLRPFLDRGARLRGVIASVEDGGFQPKDPDLEACIVDRRQAIEVLKALRRERLAPEQAHGR
ncbi:MAG: ERCC4 domain-containing protein [Candidatus Brocadiia bacterium]